MPGRGSRVAAATKALSMAGDSSTWFAIASMASERT
jgi:hypothetical protein